MKDPVPIVQEDGWATGSVWTGAENLAPTGIRPLDRPACSESLYLATTGYKTGLVDSYKPGQKEIATEIRNASSSYYEGKRSACRNCVVFKNRPSIL